MGKYLGRSWRKAFPSDLLFLKKQLCLPAQQELKVPTGTTSGHASSCLSWFNEPSSLNCSAFSPPWCSSQLGCLCLHTCSAPFIRAAEMTVDTCLYHLCSFSILAQGSVKDRRLFSVSKMFGGLWRFWFNAGWCGLICPLLPRGKIQMLNIRRQPGGGDISSVQAGLLSPVVSFQRLSP